MEIQRRRTRQNKNVGYVTSQSKTVLNNISEENGILDEDFELEELGMDPEQWIPAIHIYFNDDLRSHYEKNTA